MGWGAGNFGFFGHRGGAAVWHLLDLLNLEGGLQRLPITRMRLGPPVMFLYVGVPASAKAGGMHAGLIHRRAREPTGYNPGVTNLAGALP